MIEKTLLDYKKNSFQAILQKFFLKILKIISPKNYERNKNFFRNFLNSIKKILKNILLYIFLKIKYPMYYRLPLNHLNYFDKFRFFSKILKEDKIKFFLLGGTLLGAIRQESFAGRPTDIDIGIKSNDEKRLKKSLNKIVKKGGMRIKHITLKDKTRKYQIIFKSVLMDISIIKKLKHKNKLCWIGDSDDKKTIKFSYTSLQKLISIKLYGRSYLSPSNPESYLKQKYGSNWRIPDKKQFLWKKINLQ
jgi:phosphorylcholine metabolism protein LicD